mmetsp:Transcript_58263/g.153266  ORF Transcript_58263/g.153266 Transcript_58263/m.153266 type:complete len:313 (-) Transcript_58263:532-1470(-)
MSRKHNQSPTAISGSSAHPATTSMLSHVGPNSFVPTTPPLLLFATARTSGRAVTTAWSNTTQLNDPYTPSLMYSATSACRAAAGASAPSPCPCPPENWFSACASASFPGRAPKDSISPASASCDADRARFAITATAYEWLAEHMYRPGSAITSTPHPAGKCFSSAPDTVRATSSNRRLPPSCPGYPPPTSSSDGENPYDRASSNASRADATASANGCRSPHPDPTWKLNPSMSSESSRAVDRSASHSRGGAPNLELNRHTDLESSTAIRMMIRASGNSFWIFRSSSTLSAVIRRTSFARANRSIDACLHGFA